jgi:hypothetical protein
MAKQVKVHPSWAPIGAARFKELVQTNFYDDQRFFRVLDGMYVLLHIVLNQQQCFSSCACGLPRPPAPNPGTQQGFAHASRRDWLLVSIGVALARMMNFCVPHCVDRTIRYDIWIAQFGMHGDPSVHAEWQSKKIQDDPVTQSNTRGTICFAMSGKRHISLLLHHFPGVWG